MWQKLQNHFVNYMPVPVLLDKTNEILDCLILMVNYAKVF